MAFLVRRPSGSWELRESRSTPHGPRSRTLASFRELTPAVLRKARARASSPLRADEIRRSAWRNGAPLVSTGRLGGALLAEIGEGHPPTPGLRRLLLETLGAGPDVPVTGEERAAAEWLVESIDQRGRALVDLLLLADAMPQRRRGPASKFPRISSRPD